MLFGDAKKMLEGPDRAQELTGVAAASFGCSGSGPRKASFASRRSLSFSPIPLLVGDRLLVSFRGAGGRGEPARDTYSCPDRPSISA
jgi:hypothetical protein